MGLFSRKSDGDGPLVLLVGHCLPDSMGLQRAVGKADSSARTKRVMSDEDLDAAAGKAALLLVNRKLDGTFGARDGIELIATMRERVGDGGPRLMLVSNFAEAQGAAVEAGALPGFGKSDLRDGATIERIAGAIGEGIGRGSGAQERGA